MCGVARSRDAVRQVAAQRVCAARSRAGEPGGAAAMETCTVLVSGDRGAGKTSLIGRFVSGHFCQQLGSGEEARTNQKMHYVGSRRTKFVISEAGDAGNLRKILLQSDPSDVDAVLLCFPLSEPGGLAGAAERLAGLRARHPSLPALLVGTKSDCRPQTAIPYQQAAIMASRAGAAAYIETSARLSYSSAVAAFEAAAESGEPRPTETLAGPGTGLGPSLSPGRRTFSLSSGSLASRSSTLSSSRSGSSSSRSHTRTPLLGRRSGAGSSGRDQAQPAMVTIRCERLNSEKQVEEVEIEIPASVYHNIDSRQSETEFERNSRKRSSLASKLRHLILR